MKTPAAFLAHALGIAPSQAAALLAGCTEEEVVDIIATVDLLEQNLAPDRLPVLARRPVDALDGRSLLAALADDPARTRRLCEDAFDLRRIQP